MKLTFIREQMSQKYKNIHTQRFYNLELFEKIEAGVFPSCLGAKATQIINWINYDYTSKTYTDLYAHRSLNDLIYALQYFYGVTFVNVNQNVDHRAHQKIDHHGKNQST
ncbi:hypothetical protein, partial [Brevibacillus sp. AY1]|uniref:hypothetical protein n=1 Tax=Brevibacillus sp. AY1 TaxID=2807621 RepID=UPI002457A942